jgi:hypothetical protein
MTAARPDSRIVPPKGGANPPGGPSLDVLELAGRRAAQLDRFWHGLGPVALPPPGELHSIVQRPASLTRGEH